MNLKLAFDFSVNKEKNTITIEREFAADRSLVWDAYTKSEILDQWWAPKPWKTKTKTMDFREGGYWHYAMIGPNGEEFWSWADYIQIIFQEKYSGLDAFSDSEGNKNTSLPQSKWEVKFIDNGEKTLVHYHISYADLAQLEATIQMGFKEGMTMALENLDSLLLTLNN